MQALDIALYPGDFLISSITTKYMRDGYAATYATAFVIRHCLFLRRMLLLCTFNKHLVRSNLNILCFFITNKIVYILQLSSIDMLI